MRQADLGESGLRWRDEARIRVVTFARPPVNALNWSMKRALLALLDDTGRRDSIRAVIFTSELDKTFCAGSDLFELAQDHDHPGSALERTRFEYRLWEQLSALPQVSVAAVEGYALGSGLELCIACDFRVAGARATFGLPEIKIGGGPGVQSLARLPHMVGLGAARRMLLLGESLTAKAAQEAGLVDVVVGPGDAVGVALELAAQLGSLPASSIRYLKAAIAAAVAPSLERVEASVFGEVERLFMSPEMREGIAAFLEKRAPDFRSIGNDKHG